MNEWLFSYGTLREERVQQKLFGRKLTGAADRLSGYKLAGIEIADENFLSLGEQKNQSTLVYTGMPQDIIDGMALSVTTDELLLADKYEPENYKRESVILKSGKKAWIYLEK